MMYRHNNSRFNVPTAGRSGNHQGPPPPRRTQDGFHKEVPYKQRKETKQSNQPQTSIPPPAFKKSTSPGLNKWKSSFTTIGKDDKDNSSSRRRSDNGSTEDRNSERSQLYDPYEPVMSDSDENPSPTLQKDLQESRGRWDIEASIERQRLSPGPPLFTSRDSESMDRTVYSSGSTAGDHRASDYRTEMASKVRLSPPPLLQHNYKQSPGFTGLDQLPPHRQEVKEPGKNEVMTDKNLISCDLCEVELSNGQELEEHLDSKCHWDTLEYIQKHNSYDDMAIAFLQDVMMYKSRKCSRAIEDTALQALQEYDHMTKVEMFHCAACNVFVPTSASAVQNHITTQQHMSNTKNFQVQQRRSCLNKANTMMKELTPQFQCFVKGMSPFE